MTTDLHLQRLVPFGDARRLPAADHRYATQFIDLHVVWSCLPVVFIRSQQRHPNLPAYFSWRSGHAAQTDSYRILSPQVHLASREKAASIIHGLFRTNWSQLRVLSLRQPGVSTRNHCRRRRSRRCHPSRRSHDGCYLVPSRVQHGEMHTSFLVLPDLVLTQAHRLFTASAFQWASLATIYLGHSVREYQILWMSHHFNSKSLPWMMMKCIVRANSENSTAVGAKALRVQFSASEAP